MASKGKGDDKGKGDGKGDDSAAGGDGGDVGGFDFDQEGGDDAHTMAVHEFLRKSRDEDIRDNYHRQAPWTLQMSDFKIDNTCDVAFNPFVVVRLENQMAQAECCELLGLSCCGAESTTEMLAKFEMTAVHMNLDSGEEVLLPSSLKFKSWPHIRGCTKKDGWCLQGRSCHLLDASKNPLYMSYSDLLNYRVVVELWSYDGWFPNVLLGYRAFQLRTLVASDPMQGFDIPNRHTLPGATAANLARVSFRAVLETNRLRHEVRLSRFSMTVSHTVLNTIAMASEGCCVSPPPASKHLPGLIASGASAPRIMVDISCRGSLNKKTVVHKAAPLSYDVLRGDTVDAVSNFDLGTAAKGPREGLSPLIGFECSRSVLEAKQLEAQVTLLLGSYGVCKSSVKGFARLPLSGLTSAGVLPVAGFVVFAPGKLDARGSIPTARFRMIERARERLKLAYDKQVRDDERRAAEKRKKNMSDNMPAKLLYVALPTFVSGRVVGAYIRGFAEWRAVGDRLIQLFSQPSAGGGSDVVFGNTGKSEGGATGDSKAAAGGGDDDEDAAIGEHGEVPAGPVAGPAALVVNDDGASVGVEKSEVRETARVPIRSLTSRVGFRKHAGFAAAPRLAIQVARLRLVDKAPASLVGSTSMRVLVNFAGGRQSTTSVGLDDQAAAQFNHWSIFPMPPVPGTVDMTFDKILNHYREPVLAALAPLRDCIVEGWADSSMDPFAGGGESVAHMVEPPRRIVSSRFVIPFHRLIPYVPAEARRITQARRLQESGARFPFSSLEPSPDRILPAVAMDVPLFAPGNPASVGFLTLRLQLLGLQRPDPSPTPSVTMPPKVQTAALKQRTVWVAPAPGLPVSLGVSLVSAMPTAWRERVTYRREADEDAATRLELAELRKEPGAKPSSGGGGGAAAKDADAGAGVGEGDSKALGSGGEAGGAAAGGAAAASAAGGGGGEAEDEDDDSEEDDPEADPETRAAMLASQSRAFPLAGAAVGSAANTDDPSTATIGLRALWAAFIEATTDGLASEREVGEHLQTALQGRGTLPGGELPVSASVPSGQIQKWLEHLRWVGPKGGPARPGVLPKSHYGSPNAVNVSWLLDEGPSLPRLHHRARALPAWWRAIRDVWLDSHMLNTREGRLQDWLRRASFTAHLLHSMHPSEVRFMTELKNRMIRDDRSSTETTSVVDGVAANVNANRLQVLRELTCSGPGSVIPGAAPPGGTWLHAVHPLLTFYDEDGNPRPLTQAVAPIPMATMSIVAACTLKAEFERVLLLANHSSLANSDSLRALDLLENKLSDEAGFRTVHLRHRRHLAWRVARLVRAVEFARPTDLFGEAADWGAKRVGSLASTISRDMEKVGADASYDSKTTLANPDVPKTRHVDKMPLFRFPPRYVPPALRQVMAQLPRVWMRLGTVADYARGGAAEHAALLCSLLLGIGENAYVCMGLVRRRKPVLDKSTALLIADNRRFNTNRPLEAQRLDKEADDILTRKKLTELPNPDTTLGPDAILAVGRRAAAAGSVPVPSSAQDLDARDDVVAATAADKRDATKPLKLRAEDFTTFDAPRTVFSASVASAAAASQADTAAAAGAAAAGEGPGSSWYSYYLTQAREEERLLGRDAPAEKPAADMPDGVAGAGGEREAKASFGDAEAAGAVLVAPGASSAAAAGRGGVATAVVADTDGTTAVVAVGAPPGAAGAGGAVGAGGQPKERGARRKVPIRTGLEAMLLGATADEEEQDASEVAAMVLRGRGVDVDVDFLDDSSVESDAEDDPQDQGAPALAAPGPPGVIGVIGAMFGAWSGAAEAPAPAVVGDPVPPQLVAPEDGEDPATPAEQAGGVAAEAGGEPQEHEAHLALADGKDLDDDADDASISSSTRRQQLVEEPLDAGGATADAIDFTYVPKLQDIKTGMRPTSAANAGDAAGGEPAAAEAGATKVEGEDLVVGFGLDEEECLAAKSVPSNEEEVLAFWVVTYPTVRDCVESDASNGEMPTGGSEFRGSGARYSRFLYSFRTGFEHEEMREMKVEAAANAKGTVKSDDDTPEDGWKMSKDETPSTFPLDGDRPAGAEHVGVEHPSRKGGAYASECETSLTAFVRDAIPDFWTPSGDVLPGRYQQGINTHLSEKTRTRAATGLRRVVDRLRYRRPMLMFNHKNVWINKQTDCDERRKRWRLLRRALALQEPLKLEHVTALSMLAAKDLGFEDWNDPDKLTQYLAMERPHEFNAKMQEARLARARAEAQRKAKIASDEQGADGAAAAAAAAAAGVEEPEDEEAAMKVTEDDSFEQICRKLRWAQAKRPFMHFDDIGLDRTAALASESAGANDTLAQFAENSMSSELQKRAARSQKSTELRLKQEKKLQEYRWKFFTRRRDVASINPPTAASLRNSKLGQPDPGLEHGLLPSRCCDTCWDLRDRDCWMPLLDVRGHAEERRAVADVVGGFRPGLVVEESKIRGGKPDKSRLRKVTVDGADGKPLHLRVPDRDARAGACGCFSTVGFEAAEGAVRDFDVSMHGLVGASAGHMAGSAPAALVGPPLRRQLSLLETDRLTREIGSEVEGAIMGLRVSKRLPEGVVFDRRAYPVVRDTMKALLMSRALAMNFEPGSQDRRMADTLTEEVRKRVLDLMAISGTRVAAAQKEAQSAGRVRGHIDAWVTRVQMPTDIRQLVQDTVSPASPILSKTEAEIVVEAFVESLSTGIVYTRFIALTVFAE